MLTRLIIATAAPVESAQARAALPQYKTIPAALPDELSPAAEVPLGLVTAVAGGPFFILLLARRLRA